MTDEEIIDNWFESTSNRMNIMTIAFEEPVYRFIEDGCEMRMYGDEKFYKVNGHWYKLHLLKEKTT